MKDTGAISDSNEKPNLATFPGLTLFFQANKANEPKIQDRTNDVNADKQQKAADQPTAPRNNQAESNSGAANANAAQEPTTEQPNEQVKTNGEQSDKTEDSTQIEPAAAKQPAKPDLSTFPGLSMFFTDVKNTDTKDDAAKTPAQDTNAGKNDQDQTNAEGNKTPAATLTPAEKVPAAPKKDAALTAAASDLQNAIAKGDTYVNSDKFTQMTVEKQKQLRDAIQTGKELMAKYNTMQAAMNSAALEVDQNNKNKAKTNANVAALATLNVNNNTPADTNTNPSTSADKAATDINNTPATANTPVTVPELKQAAQSIFALLGTGTSAVNSNISYDASTETVTISGGEISGTRYGSSYYNWAAVSMRNHIITGPVKHIKITGPVTIQNGNASNLFDGSDIPYITSVQDITGLNNLDTSNVTTMERMFAGNESISSINFSSSFDTSQVTSMRDMFGDDKVLKSLDLSHFNTHKVSDSFDTFFGTYLNKVTLGDQTVFNSESNLSGEASETTWYEATDRTNVSRLVDGRPHPGTWIRIDGTITLKFINAKHPDQVVYTGQTINGSSTDTLDLTDSMNKKTYITDNIPKGYHYASHSELNGKIQPTSVAFTKDGNIVDVYVAGDKENNITVKFIRATDNHIFKTDNPEGQVGDTLDLKSNDTYVTSNMPSGYHYATGTELNNHTQATASAVYSTTAQENDIYVAGDNVPDDGTNKDAVHVLHYLESQDDKPTTDKVPGIKVDDYWLGGAYGDTVTASGSDDKQKAPTGYTIVNPKKQSYELVKNATKQPEFVFYYKADKEANLSVQYVNARTGKDVGKAIKAPDGYMDKPFDPTDDNSFITANIPDGYHYAKTSDELNGKTQPKNDGSIKYTDKDDTVTVYVAGDNVPDDGTNTDAVPGMADKDYWLGGHYGDTVTASGTDEKQKAPAGYTIANPDKQSYELVKGATTQPEFIFYYKAVEQSNVTITYVNAKTGETVGDVYKPKGATDAPIKLKGGIPDGYHYAETTDELNGKTQPNAENAKYTTGDQSFTVYVAGDTVPDDGTNKDAVHVLHYLESQDDKPTTDKVPGIKVDDYWLGGAYGDTVTASGTDEKQKAPTGYTIVNPKEQSYELIKGATTQPEFIFYYKADKEANLSVQYVNARTGKDVGKAIKAPDGYMDKPFDPTDDNSFITANIPDGYHYAKTSDELNGKTQPKNDGSIKYTDKDDTVTVYVAGDNVPDDGTNKDAVHVLHYLESQDDTPTTDAVPGMADKDYWLGGQYGDTVKASGDDAKQKAPDGYTLVNPGKQSAELTKGQKQEIKFYYKADAEAHLSVQYVNARTGKDVGQAIKAPDGYMNETFDPTDSNSFIVSSIPASYHYAKTSAELNGKTQPKNDGSVKYTDQADTVTVYVAGDSVPDDGSNTDAIHVLHRLQSDDSELSGSYWIGGNYGDEITVKDSDAKQTVPGYTIVPKDSVTLELTQDTPQQVIFYYTADTQNNVTINFTTKNGTIIKSDVPQGHHTGDTLDIGADSPYFTTTKPNGFSYASGTDVPNGYIQPDHVDYTADRQTVTIYVVGDPVDTGDTVKVVHYLEGTTKPVPGLTDYVLGDGGHYGDTVTASGDDAAQKAPFGYKLVNPDAQTYVLTKGASRTFIFYYTKNGGGSLPEPDWTPKLPIPGEVDIPQGTDLSGDTTYAGNAITNKDQMPDGTKYSWQPTPDTSKKGKQTGTVVVTYPDGTKFSVKVTINIVDKKANTGDDNHGTAKEELLKHNAYLYGQDGKRANKAVLKAGSTVTTYGMVVINGRKFFTLDNDYYLATGNVWSQNRKLKHNAYIYNKYGQRVGKKVVKTGQSMATYGTVVTIRGKKYYTIDHDHFMKANNFMKIAYPDLANSELSPNAKQDSDKAFTVKALQHNAYLYNKEGKRANKVILNLNSKVKTYGMKTINGRKFYVAANNYYIAAGNIDATKRKLTHNAYIYSQYGNRIGRKVVKQHQVVGTYSDPVGIRGKSYYIIGSGRYLKRANFETR